MERIREVYKGQGYGYVDEQGALCMVRCFECGRENWAPAVSGGKCAYCRYDPNSDKKEDIVMKKIGL